MSTPYDTPGPVTCVGVTGVGEVREGDDLAAMLGRAAGLRDGDVLVVTSKVVSKAEGSVVVGPGADRDAAVAAETDRVVARRGPTSIVRTRHGFVMAAAGVDASNTAPGTLVLLPRDPDGSARALRDTIAGAAGGGPNVAVLVSDTSGRAWRNGQTDLAVGAAGLDVLHDYAGRTDHHGNVLAVTAPAVADEIAGAADLVKGKLSRCPAAVVRGLGALVLPRGQHGPGAAALVRPEGGDMFGLGAREAVLHAVRRTDGRGFGDPAPPETVLDALAGLVPAARPVVVDGRLSVTLPAGDGPTAWRRLGADAERLTAAAYAMGWVAATETDSGTVLGFAPRTP